MVRKTENSILLKESDELTASRFKALLENAFEGIVLYDSSGVIQYASPSIKTFFGYTHHDVLGRKGTEFVYPDDVEEAREAFFKVLLRAGNTITRVQRFITKKGAVRWSEYTLTNLLHNPDVRGVVSNFRDIHERKVVEDQLQKKEQLLAAISKNITEGIYRSIPGKKFAYVNRAFLELFGYRSLEELNTHAKPGDLYADKKQLRIVREMIREHREMRNVEVLFKRKDGEKFWASVSCILIKDQRGEIFYDGAIRDITKQKETEKQLHESRNFLDNVMRTVAAPIFVKDAKHRWVMFNDAFCWFMDKTRKELLNKTDSDFLSRENSAEYRKIDNQVLRTGDVVINREKISLKKRIRHLLTVKSRYVNDVGERFVIGFITDITEIKKREEEINKLNANLLGVMESTQDSIYAIDRNYKYIAFNKNHAQMSKMIYGSPISIGDNPLSPLKGTPERKWLENELKQAMKGKHFVSERKINQPRYKNKNIETTYNPIFDKKNKVTGVAVFIRDITERKKSMEKLKILNDNLASQNWKLAAQEEELKSTLDELSERNFELDQLMYKTSHDLRSPLSSILGLVNLAHLDSDQHNHMMYLNKIEGRVKKLDEFIKSMLNYARVNRSEVVNEQVNLQDIIESSIQELEYLENFSAIQIQATVKNSQVTFRTDPLRLQIVIANIISNAYKYYNPSVKSRLKISATILPQVVEIVFSDNGIGIKQEYLKKVFDMFYRATEKSQGSGLGMYIVKQAIDKMGGTIKVKSTFGKGTTIKIALPNN